MSKIAYQYEYQIDVKDIELTPHETNGVSAVWGMRRVQCWDMRAEGTLPA